MNKIMVSIIQQSLAFEILMRKVITIDFPTRDDICSDPCESINLVLNRIDCNNYKNPGQITDFKHDYIEGNEGKDFKFLLENEWDFQVVYNELELIINDYLQLRSDSF